MTKTMKFLAMILQNQVIKKVVMEIIKLSKDIVFVVQHLLTRILFFFTGNLLDGGLNVLKIVVIVKKKFQLGNKLER